MAGNTFDNGDKSEAFNVAGGKTALDIAIDKLLANGGSRELKTVQLLLQSRETPKDKTPMDIALENVAKRGLAQDVEVLRVLVEASLKSGVERLAIAGNPAIVAKILLDDDGRTPVETLIGVKRTDVPPNSVRNNPNKKF